MKLLLLSTLEAYADKLEKNIPDLARKKVLCITTAAIGEGSPDWMESEMTPLQDKAQSFRTFDLSGASKADLEEAMNDIDIVYVMGGNTYYLLEHVKKSGFEAVLKSKFAQGLIYIGVSAGSIICGPRIDFIGNIDDPTIATLDNYSAMQLIDDIILPHLDSPTFHEKLIPVIEDLKNRNDSFIGIRDGQGIYFDGSFMRFD
jgi:dipeptidase E